MVTQWVPRTLALGALAAALMMAQTGDSGKWSTAGKMQTASLAGLALADYHSTQRGLARGGREVGPVLSCGGQLCAGRYLGLNVGVVAGMYFVTRYAVPKLPPRWRKATNIMINTMVIGRGAVVVSNYQKAAALGR